MNLPPLGPELAASGLLARKRLGQHFLLDRNLCRRIVREAGRLDGLTVFEIGPGPGGLTRALLESDAARIVAIEKDRRFEPLLAPLGEAYPGRFELRFADALDTDLATFAPPPRAIVANLPYNVATPLLIGWLRHARDFVQITAMVQREVALRLAAQPDEPNYGRLSIIAQFRCEVRRLFDIAPEAFVPPPKVWSSLVALRPHDEPPCEADLAILERVTQAAFGQRRKMLRSALKSLGGEELLTQAGIDPTARAETLSLAQFCALARALTDQPLPSASARSRATRAGKPC